MRDHSLAIVAISAVSVVAAFALQALPQSELSTAPREPDSDIISKRSEWFYGQRMYPNRQLPAPLRLKALSALERMMRSEPANRSRPSTAMASWSPIGPQPALEYNNTQVSGRVTALVVDPGDPNTVYLGAAEGGVWKTTNGGTSWSPLTDDQPSLAVGSIALDPSDPNTVYVGTGDEDNGYFGAGILKSTDGGASWNQICGPFCGPVGSDEFYGGGSRIGALAVDPNNPQILLAGVQLLFHDGIYRSSDGGQSSSQVLSGGWGSGVVFDPTNVNVAYAVLSSSYRGATEGIYKSADAGITWTAVNGSGTNTLPLSNAGRIVLAMARSNPTTLYASIANVNDSSLLGFFKTTDGGDDWKALTVPDYCTPQCSYDNAIAVQPTNPDVIYAGGSFHTTLVRSLDGGSSWTTLQSAYKGDTLHADTQVLAFSNDGSRLYVGDDGGAWSTTQVTAANPAFTGLNATLAITQMYPGLSVSPSNTDFAIAGTQDNSTQIYSGKPLWQAVVCGDGGYTAIDAATPSTVYANCTVSEIERSTASGVRNSWSSAQSGIETNDRFLFIPPLVMDPSNSSTLYFGSDRVYQTLNQAQSWTPISPDLTAGSGFLTSIAVAPTDPNTIYTGSSDSQVQVTTNAGSGASATWTPRSAGLPPRYLTQVAVDPTVASTAYATFSGFSGFGDNLGHVFRTADGGASWADVSGNLPNVPVNSIAIAPDQPNVLFLGTDIGVFYSIDYGSQWTPLVNGLPRAVVMWLTLYHGSRTLRASTHGRSVWDIDLAWLLGPPIATPTPTATPTPIGPLTVSPTTLNFHRVTLGHQSTPKFIRVRNRKTNRSAAMIVSISTNGSDFAVDRAHTTCSSPLKAGGRCRIAVVFNPTASRASPRRPDNY